MPALFWGQAHGPVLTLVFGAAAVQYAALARIECFYESEKYAGTYLTWDAARQARVCKDYEAFNLPLAYVAQWLQALRLATEPRSDPDPLLPWWHTHCSEEENALLADLLERGILQDNGELHPSTPATYLISALASKAEVSLAHERLHALYYLSPRYRAIVQDQWEAMPRAIASAVQYDLQMRGYKASVWQDELGAYLGVRIPTTSRRDDPSNEFGNKSASTCADIRRVLLQQIPQCWRDDVGVDESTLYLSQEYIDQAKQALMPPPPAPRPAKASQVRRGRKR
ncbi:enhancer of mRNA decapping [Malassezia pachydermatis]|uniref:Uncharacterized protein n=1 Tax=Malassezia pachydermatis TaxID=77020 RepID=A0A0M8MVF7_9BASI|nr:hypothetical protein Malapachy_3810 [Malassezia pachydermatis]KOS14371.1 hypothetical protein Malapachy_3810 [Malassezia pachydermatis]